MDHRTPPDSPHTAFGQTDAEAVPDDSVREGSSIIYFGSAQQISEGFAIALRAMGFEAMPSNIARSDTTSNPEDG